MKYYSIIQKGNKNISKISKKVPIPLSVKTRQIIQNLKKWVLDSNNDKLAKKYNLIPAVGIAAVQVNILCRIFYIYHSKYKFNQVFINPEMVSHSMEYCKLEFGEGCLSLKNFGRQNAIRYRSVTIKYYNYINSKVETKTFYNLYAIIIQHELDHLNGLLCLDRHNQNLLLSWNCNPNDLVNKIIFY